MEKRPADFVTDTLGGAQYYGNKILKEYKEKYESDTPNRLPNQLTDAQRQDTRGIHSSLLQDLPLLICIRQGTFRDWSDME